MNNKIKSLIKRIDKSDLRILFLVLVPAIVFLITFFKMDNLVYPASIGAIIAFIIVYYWNFTKYFLSASIVSILSFLAVIFIFSLVAYMILKYTNGEIAWNVSLIEMMGLEKYF